MFNRFPQRLAGLVGLFVLFTMSSVGKAAEPTTATVITVGEMCGGCVKNIQSRFDGVKGIASVRCDVESKSVTLRPEKGYRLSPRGLWIAMEKIGKTPVKLAGPGGVFTSKPEKSR